MYKKAQASIWTTEEIDLSHDMVHWEKLNDLVRSGRGVCVFRKLGG